MPFLLVLGGVLGMGALFAGLRERRRQSSPEAVQKLGLSGDPFARGR
jgi:hypothetical protein